MREWRLKVPFFASFDTLNFAPFARTFFHCIRRVSCLGFIAQFTLTIYRYPRPIRFLTTRFDHVFRSSRLIRSIRTPGQNPFINHRSVVTRGNFSYSTFDYTKDVRISRDKQLPFVYIFL